MKINSRFLLSLCAFAFATTALTARAGVLDNLKKKANEITQQATQPTAPTDTPAASEPAPASTEAPTGKLAVAVPVIIGTYNAPRIEVLANDKITSFSGTVQVLRVGDRRVRVSVKDHPECAAIETDLEVGEAANNDSIFGGPADEYVTLRLEVNGPATLFAANKKGSTTWEVVNGAKALQPKPVKLNVNLTDNVGIKRVYWSGDAALNPAKAFASSTGATIIINTDGSSLTKKQTEHANKEQTIKLWSEYSADFARSTTGEVHVFISNREQITDEGEHYSDLTDPRIWRDVEFPILNQQGNPIVYHTDKNGKWAITTP
jgi:hypothetical protein